MDAEGALLPRVDILFVFGRIPAGMAKPAHFLISGIHFSPCRSPVDDGTAPTGEECFSGDLRRTVKKIILLANDTTYTFNLRDELIEGFLRENFEVVVIAEKLRHVEELETMGCRLIDLSVGRRGKNPFSDLNLLHAYQKLLKKESPTAVVSYNIKPNIYGGMACRKLQIPFFPNITGLGTALEYPGKLQILTIRLYRSGMRSAFAVFFQNGENRRFFEENNLLDPKTERILLPGSGVNLEKHRLLAYPKGEKKMNFLFIARIMKEKGIGLYLNAAKHIHKEYPDTMFHICGYCDDPSWLESIRLGCEEGYITYHGEQDDLLPFFQMADCIVHPSWYPEGMSNVLLEAAAHGRPVITTDRPGCRETVEDGKTGYIVPICDEGSLLKAIRRFLALSEKEREAMGLYARRKMEEGFDRKLVADAYLKALSRVS